MTVAKDGVTVDDADTFEWGDDGDVANDDVDVDENLVEVAAADDNMVLEAVVADVEEVVIIIGLVDD